MAAPLPQIAALMERINASSGNTLKVYTSTDGDELYISVGNNEYIEVNWSESETVGRGITWPARYVISVAAYAPHGGESSRTDVGEVYEPAAARALVRD